MQFSSKFLFKASKKIAFCLICSLMITGLVSCSNNQTFLDKWKELGVLPQSLSFNDFCDKFYLDRTEYAWDWWDQKLNPNGDGTYQWEPKYPTLNNAMKSYVFDEKNFDKKLNKDPNVLRDALYRLYEMADRLFTSQNMISYKSTRREDEASFFDLDNVNPKGIKFSSNLESTLIEQSKFVNDFHNARKKICSVSESDFNVDRVKTKETLDKVKKIDIVALNNQLNKLLLDYNSNLGEVNKIYKIWNKQKNDSAKMTNNTSYLPQCREYQTSNPKYVIVKCENLP